MNAGQRQTVKSCTAGAGTENTEMRIYDIGENRYLYKKGVSEMTHPEFILKPSLKSSDL